MSDIIKEHLTWGSSNKHFKVFGQKNIEKGRNVLLGTEGLVRKIGLTDLFQWY